jgi:prevent-host-death family protein
MEVNVHEARTHSSRLLERVALGEEIIIAKAGKPAAKLVPLVSDRPRFKLGSARGTNSSFRMTSTIRDPKKLKICSGHEGFFDTHVFLWGRQAWRCITATRLIAC